MGSIPSRGIELPSAFGDMANKIKKKKKDHFTLDLPPIPFLISFSKKEKNSINLEMFIA